MLTKERLLRESSQRKIVVEIDKSSCPTSKEKNKEIVESVLDGNPSDKSHLNKQKKQATNNVVH